MVLIATHVSRKLAIEFELLAKMQHKTKSQLSKEIIQNYLHKKNMSPYIKMAEHIAIHEKNHPMEYIDLYCLAQDWESINQELRNKVI